MPLALPVGSAPASIATTLKLSLCPTLLFSVLHRCYFCMHLLHIILFPGESGPKTITFCNGIREKNVWNLRNSLEHLLVLPG